MRIPFSIEKKNHHEINGMIIIAMSRRSQHKAFYVLRMDQGSNLFNGQLQNLHVLLWRKSK